MNDLLCYVAVYVAGMVTGFLLLAVCNAAAESDRESDHIYRAWQKPRDDE